MSGKLITNNAVLLEEVVRHDLPLAKQFDALVGYFYFSGFDLIAGELRDKPVRILVGMNAEQVIVDKVVEYEPERIRNRSHQRRAYLEGLRRSINSTAEFENQETAQAWEVFVEKLGNGTLQIRQTLEPNHSKLYLFYRDGQQMAFQSPGRVITGSSNLTRSGLASRKEANVILDGAEDFAQAREYFEELWSTAAILVDGPRLGEFQSLVADKVWLNRTPSPYLMYIRVLHEYFTRNESLVRTAHDIDKDFADLTYQRDAVVRALQIIRAHQGVIIADVVGLGKSVTASTVAHNLKLQGEIKKSIVIAPPHLCAQWEEYGRRFDYNARVYSRGRLAHALEEEESPEQKLVIIDEAHAFRNEQTQDYELLQKLCRNNLVIILTATPFSNTPADLYALVKLFQIPGASTLATVGNIKERFEGLIRSFKRIKTKKELSVRDEAELDVIAKQVRHLIEPLVIRRSRIDLEQVTRYRRNIQAQGIEFAEVAEPILHEYDLGRIRDSYLATLFKMIPPQGAFTDSDYQGFKAVKYTPLSYLKPDSEYVAAVMDEYNIINKEFVHTFQENLALFMRSHLVKRYESSIAAFSKSLENMISYHQVTIDWYEKLKVVGLYKKGQLPSYDEVMDDWSGQDTTETADQEVLAGSNIIKRLQQKGLLLIPASEFEREYILEVRSDKQILESIKREWDEIFKSGYDPKLDYMLQTIEEIGQSEPKRKIIIFSEYADTVHYVHQQLADRGLRVIKYTSRDKARVRGVLKRNFDAGLKPERQADDYDILVATDALSEGINLHRAGAIINYDIPYNPTRVIQRVGRINRINKKVFSQLYIHNYFPSLVGSKIYRVEQLAVIKMQMIHRILGEDTKVLRADETQDLHSFLKESFRAAVQEDQTQSWDVPYLELLDQTKDTQSETLRSALKLPKRSKVARTEYDRDLLLTLEKTSPAMAGLTNTPHPVLIFTKKGTDFYFQLSLAKQAVKISAEEGLALFAASPEEVGQKLSDVFYDNYRSTAPSLLDEGYDTQDKTYRVLEFLLAAMEEFEIEDEYIQDLVDKVGKYAALSYKENKYLRSLQSQFEILDSAVAVKGIIAEMKARITPETLEQITRKIKKITEMPEEILYIEELRVHPE